MKTGIVNLPLHGGQCPKWLFPRMKNLAREISKTIVYEYGTDELLKRLSDPYWFQAFACVLAYDWHSSGTTTVTCGALKEAGLQDIGIAVCGGKGGASRKTPQEILAKGESLGVSDGKISTMIYSSKMAAKVDNSCVQDGYQLYHHVFIFTERGEWSVIQQGLNNASHYARRYHWLNAENFLEDPQLIMGRREEHVLNMSSRESKEAQKISVDIVRDMEFLNMPKHHEIRELTPRTLKTLQQAHEIQPKNYEELLSLRGVGPQSIRALALLSQLIYGAQPSWKDPVQFSFSHGGKDGIPFPVLRKTMDKSIEVLRTAIDSAKIGEKDKLFAIKRLNDFLS